MNHDDLNGILLKEVPALMLFLKEHADDAERLRQVPPASVRKLLDAGLMRLSTPRRFGGAEAEIHTQFAVSWELGRVCGSTAWCYAVWSAHHWWLNRFSEQCQEEYYSTGPDALISSGINPYSGCATKIAGGYRVTGRWSFSSGCDAANWAIVACGSDYENMLWLMLPRNDYVIEDNWFTSGLRGTGSKDVVIRDAFVPDYRVIDANASIGRVGSKGEDRNISHQVPLRMFAGWTLVAPIIGMAQGIIDEFTLRPVSQGSLQLHLAKASAEVDTARILHRSDVVEILGQARAGREFSELDFARYRRDWCFAVRLCVQAAGRLYAASGAQAIMDSNPIQRLYRDIHAASHHGSLNWDFEAQQFSRLRFGH